MALSYVEYVGNGTQTDFAFSFPYISPSHVKVTVNGADTPFTFFTSSIVRVTPAPINGTTVRVARLTPETPLVNFVDGSTLTEADLDISTLQSIYLAQEAVDKSAQQAGSVTASQITDASANGRSIITAADFATMKTLLGITAADITNASANGRSLITAVDYAAMRTLLGFTTANITDMSANGRSLVTAANYAAMKTLLAITAADITNASANGRSLIAAVDYAAMKTLLAITAADITNASANGRSLITAADYAAMRTLLGFTTTNITDMSANGRSLVTAASYAAMKTLLAVTAADITDASANGRSLITALDYAAMRTLLGLTAPATAAFASQAQATAGSDNTTVMTPLRTAQAIAALAPGGGGGGTAIGTTFTAAGNISAANVQAAIEELDAEKAPVSHTHTVANISDMSANGRSLVQAADYAAMRTLLGFTTANITDMSANGRSLVTAANYAAMKTLLAITSADVTDASANGRSLIQAADYAAMRTLLSLTAPATAAFASNAQATAGTDNTTVMTPLRTAEAIAALAPGGGGGAPSGSIISYAGRNAPSGWLLCDGSNVSRTAFPNLFAAMCPVVGNFTVTIATPAVVTLTNHGLRLGDRVRLTTTGALPTGLATGTDYFVNPIDANTFNLRTTQGGANINTSGTQSGVHTMQFFGFGAGDGSTTFGIPDLRGRVVAGSDIMGGTAAGRITAPGQAGIYGQAIGSAGGAQDQALASAQMPSHSHNITGWGTGSGGALLTWANATATGNTQQVTATNGSGQVHNNVQPTLIANYIIKT